MTALIVGVRQWTCPNCSFTDVTHEARPHTRYHSCPGLHGLTAPMVEAGTRVKISAVEREDYIGNENVGRVMAVKTERPDGSTDIAVFAPTAVASVKE